MSGITEYILIKILQRSYSPLFTHFTQQLLLWRENVIRLIIITLSSHYLQEFLFYSHTQVFEFVHITKERKRKNTMKKNTQCVFVDVKMINNWWISWKERKKTRHDKNTMNNLLLSWLLEKRAKVTSQISYKTTFLLHTLFFHLYFKKKVLKIIISSLSLNFLIRFLFSSEKYVLIPIRNTRSKG